MNEFLASYADFYSAVMLTIMLVVLIVKGHFYTLTERVFFLLISLTIFVLIVEGFSYIVNGLSGDGYFYINYTLNWLLFILTPLLAVIWASYVNIKLHMSLHHLKKQWYYIPNLVTAEIVVLINVFTKKLFYIDQLNMFHRGWLFYIQVGILIVLALQIIYGILKHKSQLNRAAFLGLMGLVILPIVGGLLQVLFYGFASLYTMLALGVITVYIAAETIHEGQDALTKLYTRDKVIGYMQSNIQLRVPFTAILIDIDNLKEINDAYGHHIGDQAIVKLANGLRDIFPNQSMVSRLGGDEFLVVTEEMDAVAISERIDKMKSTLELNRQAHIAFSYGLYTMLADNKMGVDDILITIDERMYQQKAINKNYKRRRTDER